MNKQVLLTKDLWNKLSTYLYIDLKLRDLKPNRQADLSRYNILLKYFSKNYFTRDNFNSFIDLMKKKGYSNSYLNNFIKLAKHIDRFLKLNEIADYTYFKRPAHLVEIFTPKEIKSIAEVKMKYGRNRDLLNYRYKCMYYLFGLTGMRRAELFNLLWDDFYGEYCLLRDTKNGEERVVPIPKFVANLINKLPKLNKYVFGQIDSSEANNDLKRRCTRLKIIKKELSVHIFRHSFITTMLKQNQASVIQIARIVGHRSIESTNLYSHLLIEDLQFVQGMHPLCKEQESLQSIVVKIKNVLEQLVDKDKFSLEIKENADSFNFTLTN